MGCLGLLPGTVSPLNALFKWPHLQSFTFQLDQANALPWSARFKRFSVPKDTCARGALQSLKIESGDGRVKQNVHDTFVR